MYWPEKPVSDPYSQTGKAGDESIGPAEVIRNLAAFLLSVTLHRR